MSETTRTCPYCDEPMSNAKRVQCGTPECKRRWNNDRNRAFQRKYKAENGGWYGEKFVYDLTCRACALTFQSRNPKAPYCSNACANTTRTYERTCATCGITWTAKQTKAMYCSSRCKQARRGETTELVVWRPVPRWLRRLPVVNKPRRWYVGRCRRCSTWTTSNQSTNTYCSQRCSRADSKDRRRATKQAAFVDFVYRRRVFERDRWTCQLCHHKVERDAVVPHTKAPTLDHIIPLAKGGTHEPANCQLAHFMCNSIKGDRGGGEQLTLVG